MPLEHTNNCFVHGFARRVAVIRQSCHSQLGVDGLGDVFVRTRVTPKAYFAYWGFNLPTTGRNDLGRVRPQQGGEYFYDDRHMGWTGLCGGRLPAAGFLWSGTAHKSGKEGVLNNGTETTTLK